MDQIFENDAKNKTLHFELYPTKFCFVFKEENFSPVLELGSLAYYAKSNNGDELNKYGIPWVFIIVTER